MTFGNTRPKRSYVTLFSCAIFLLIVSTGIVAASGLADDNTVEYNLNETSNTTTFKDETVVDGLNSPLEVTFLPDGRMLVLQKNGRMVIADPETGAAETYMRIENISTNGERGLLGISLDPNFEENGYFYVYYTDGDNYNKISRFTHNESSGSLTSRGNLSSEKELWVNPDDADSCCHFGGGLGTGPDGKIYLTTGEEFDGAQAQNLNKADGKILRINRNGSIPSDNPYVNDSDALDEIWALGLRNPFTATWDEPTNRFYIGEVGGNNDSVAQEDIHLGEKGANYGWPECQGNCEDPAYSDPIYTYPHNGSGASVSVGVVYRGDQFPSEYEGALFYGDYVDQWIRYLTFDSSGNVTGSHAFAEDVGSVVDIHEGPNGSLYYVDIQGGTVNRISATNGAPVITEASADPTSGNSPLEVTFNASATDPDGDSLEYTWTFGDGTNATSQNVTHTYNESGVYTARLEVSDGNKTTLSDQIEISVGEPPDATVTAPEDGSIFIAGDTVHFEGNATDPQDGELSGDNLSWEVRFIHDEHTHPVLDGVNGTSGEFEIETSGHDYSGDTGYYINLTATDSDGLTDTDSIVIEPDKVNLTLRTNQSGLTIYLDDIARTTPYTHDTLNNFTHTVKAPTAQCVDGTKYEFVNWSDGEPATHNYTVPTSDLNLTAYYQSSGSCDVPPSDPVLQLEVDQGVSTSNSTVTGWNDQSGNGNDLRANGAPTVVDNSTPNGTAAISFDGSDDELVRTATLNGFPTGSQDRTVFVVTRYNGTGFGGVAYGRTNCNEVFGAVVSDEGDLTVQGWCSPNDYPSSTAGTGAGWLVQSIVVENDSFVHYKSGAQIDSGSHVFDTSGEKLAIGSEIDAPPYVDMDVAAVYVYDRALNDDARKQAENYLEEKYLSEDNTTNQPPTADFHYHDPVAGQSATYHSESTDTDGQIVQYEWDFDDDGIFEESTTDEEIQHTYESAGEYNVTLRVTDDDDAIDTVTKVVTVSNNSTNEAPSANDDLASVSRNSSTTIDVLANDSDPDGTLNTSSVLIEETPSNGTVAVNESSGAITYDHDGSDTTSDTFTYSVADDDGARSNNATVSITISDSTTTDDTTDVPVTDGLVLGLNASKSVTTSGGSVTDWSDLSGNENDLRANGAPTLVDNSTPNGTAAISFDGSDDELVRTATLNRFPTGSQDRTVFVVTRYNSTGFGGVAYGRTNCNEAFGAGVNDGGDLTVQGWCSSNDYPSSTAGTGAGWLVQSVVVENDSFVHYKSGAQIDSGSHVFDTGAEKLAIGSELDAPPYVDMDVAAVYVYNRSLTDTEWEAVETHLEETHLDGSTGNETNQSPTATNDSASVTRNNSTTIDVLANDDDPDGTLNVSSVLVEDEPSNGTVTVNESSGAITYDHDGSDAESDSFTYSVADDDGARSNNATVSVSVSNTSTNEAPSANDDSASVTRNNSTTIDVLANDSDPDGTLNTSSILIEETPSNGTVAVNESSGAITYDHDGSNTESDSFTYSVADDDGTRSNNATVSITISDSTTTDDTTDVPVTDGLVLGLNASKSVTTSGGSVTDWSDLSGNENDLRANGAPTLVDNSTPNGTAAISFDGSDDELVRTATLNGFPTGSQDRTVFVVTRYNGTGFGGVAYGRTNCNEAFGAVVNDGGDLTVQGWCSPNDYPSSTAGTGAGWLVQSIVVENDSFVHYKSGAQIDSGSHVFDTGAEKLAIGSELDAPPYVDMDVAAVYVYNRSLTDTEWEAVETHLEETHLDGSTGNETN